MADITRRRTGELIKILRFATIDLVKAGWMVKSKGRWFLTDEGRHAYRKYASEEEFYKEAVRLYQEWKRTRPQKEGPITEEEEVQNVSFTTTEGLRAFMSVLGTDDLGLFVSSGGFTADAKDEARTQERRKATSG